MDTDHGYLVGKWQSQELNPYLSLITCSLSPMFCL